MALDEALYEAVARGDSPPVLRLYRWHPATVTLGYAQRDPSAVKVEACRAYGFDIVRRSTGGRAVLHQHEVTYAVIAPHGSEWFPGGILESYRMIATPLQEMLSNLGIASELVPARPSTGRAGIHDFCFTAPASYELAVGEHKIAGSAQKRNERAFLQHGSVPVDLDLEVLLNVLGKPGPGAIKHLASKVGWINRYLEVPVTLDQVEEAMVSAFRKVFPVTWVVSEPEPSELARAEALFHERFSPVVQGFEEAPAIDREN